MMKLIALIVAATALLFAETKPQPKGTVQRIKVHGKSLEGNLEGDSPDRDVTIYLTADIGTGLAWGLRPPRRHF